MPRAGSIETVRIAGQTAYRFTQLGLTELQQLAQLGTPVCDLAEYFGVSETWMQKQLATEDVVKEARDFGEGDGKLELRMAAHNAAKAGDSRVLTFMLERRLKMNRTEERKVEITHKVIGTMPNHQLESENWFDKFAPPEIVYADQQNPALAHETSHEASSDDSAPQDPSRVPREVLNPTIEDMFGDDVPDFLDNEDTTQDKIT